MIQAYGAGILSSYGELDRALRTDLVSHRPFDIWECIRTPYRYDRMQKQYFVIDSFHELFSIFEQFDLIRMFEEAKEIDENTPQPKKRVDKKPLRLTPKSKYTDEQIEAAKRAIKLADEILDILDEFKKKNEIK